MSITYSPIKINAHDKHKLVREEEGRETGGQGGRLKTQNRRKPLHPKPDYLLSHTGFWGKGGGLLLHHLKEGAGIPLEP